VLGFVPGVEKGGGWLGWLEEEEARVGAGLVRRG
jgi:hypothetical protein